MWGLIQISSNDLSTNEMSVLPTYLHLNSWAKFFKIYILAKIQNYQKIY